MSWCLKPVPTGTKPGSYGLTSVAVRTKHPTTRLNPGSSGLRQQLLGLILVLLSLMVGMLGLILVLDRLILVRARYRVTRTKELL